MTTLYVTNNWDKPIAFDYAFQTYEFPVGKTVQAPLDAVRHIFGYMDMNKEPYLARLGLIQTKNDLPEGMAILSKILISEETPKQNHSLSPVMERVPLPSQKKAGGKVLQQVA
jgi:hypothetical protein